MHASNYGPIYPASDFSPTDFTGDSAVVNTSLETLLDGSSFDHLSAAESQTATATLALSRLIASDAVFSFSGHAGEGEIQFYSVDEPALDVNHLSSFVSTRAMSSPSWEVIFLEDQELDSFQDVYLVVLNGCSTGLPLNDSVNSLGHRMVVMGADLAIGFPGDVRDVLAEMWTSHFWSYVSQSATTSVGSQANIYNSCRVAATDAVDAWPDLPQAAYDVILDAQIYVAPGVSNTEFLRPARYGSSSN
jgi:hypothetical protein